MGQSAKKESEDIETTTDFSAFTRPSTPLFGENSSLQKALDVPVSKENLENEPSKQVPGTGERAWPYDFRALKAYRNQNPHHSACLEAKIRSTVGLGFYSPADEQRDRQKITGPEFQENPGGIMRAVYEDRETDVSRVAERLNPLCDSSFLSVLSSVAEDYWATGNGYLEIVRNDSDRIVGIHHLMAEKVHVYVEDLSYNRHYKISTTPEEGTMSGHADLRFARFGDRRGMLQRGLTSVGNGVGLFTYMDPDQDRVSEVIHFRRDTSMSRYYGYVDWMAAIPAMDLSKAQDQHEFDFYNNRGVPDLLIKLIGPNIDKKLVKAIEERIASTVGLGNQHKTMVARLDGEVGTTDLEAIRLGEDRTGDSDPYSGKKETFASQIVTAHRVPPLLAGIQIPGKLGANNELPNALVAFQILVIAPAQRDFMETLKVTLGDNDKSGLGLSPDDFRLNTILDRFDLDSMDTMSRMREPIMSPAAQGRDLSAGVED